MSAEEASTLTELMQEVVESGTGMKLSGLSYTAAGKTGSAEYSSVKTDSHAWFTGFAPAEDPEVCVTIIIEGAGSGGDYAVPIAKRIFDAYFGV
jgi:peptidoglycan glycosyltransferase